MKSRNKNLMLLVASTCVGLAMAEVAARMIVSDQFVHLHYYKTCNLLFCDPQTASFDGTLGFRIRPHLDFQFENSPFSVHVRTNSKGFRDDEESLSKPEFLFLGDSFTFGWGVEEDECFVSLFEQLSASKSLNMGVPGYNNIQEMLQMEEAFDSILLENPKVVLMVFENDLTGNAFPIYSAYPVLRKRGRQLVITAPVEECYRNIQKIHAPSLVRKLSSYSMVAHLTSSAVSSSTPESLSDEESSIKVSQEEYGFPMNDLETFEYAMRCLLMILEERDIPLYVFYIPSLTELTGLRDSISRTFSWIMRQLEIPHFDLTPILTVQDYYTIDGHLKISGHKKVAQSILDFFVEEGVLEEVKQQNHLTAVTLQDRKTP